MTEPSAAWVTAFQAISAPYLRNLISLCRSTTLDSAAAIHQVICATKLIVRIDPTQSRVALVMDLLSHIKEGLGWREYLDRIAECEDHNSEAAKIVSIQEIILMSDRDAQNMERLGWILLGILRPSSATVTIIRDSGRLCAQTDCARPLLIRALILSKQSDPQIILAIAKLIYPYRQVDIYREMITKSISHPNLELLQILLRTKPATLFVPHLGHLGKILDTAWTTFAKPRYPEEKLEKMMALLFSWFRDSEGRLQTEIENAIRRCVASYLADPKSSRPLIWIIQNAPELTTDAHLRELIMHRWAIQDERFLFEAMTLFVIDREQLVEWYRDHDQDASYRESFWNYPVPKQAELSIAWLDQIHPKKSARSADQ